MRHGRGAERRTAVTSDDGDDAAASGRPSGRRHHLSSLGVPAYRWWFLSQVFSSAGTMIQVVALSWLVLRVTHSGVDVGLLTTAVGSPLLLGGPWAGVLVDRVNRRRLLMVTQSLYIVLTSAQAIVTSAAVPRIWLIFVLAFAAGAVGAPDTAARQVYANDLVGADRLTSAVSLNEVVINLSRVLGPALGGVLLATLGVSACCWANAASFVPSLIVLMTHRHVASTRRSDAPRLHDQRFLTGWRYAWRHPTVRLLLALAAASGLLFNLNVPLPLLATRVFHVGAGGYGLMMSAFGVGGVVGGFLAAGARSRPERRSVVVLAAVTGAAVLATATSRNLGEFYAGLVVTGCLSIWFIARANTLVQLATVPELRGRVMAVWSMALPGFMPVTSPVVGWVGNEVGPRECFAISGVLLVSLAALGWRRRST